MRMGWGKGERKRVAGKGMGLFFNLFIAIECSSQKLGSAE